MSVVWSMSMCISNWDLSLTMRLIISDFIIIVDLLWKTTYQSCVKFDPYNLAVYLTPIRILGVKLI